MKGWTRIKSRCVPLDRHDVDTDQIIPARFLLTTDREGLASALFADWRDEAGLVLHDPRYAGARVLVAGRNFGCGSSREHAVWALQSFGFRAIVAPSFADIFRANAHACGLLPVTMDETAHATLVRAVTDHPKTEVDIDLERGEIWYADVEPISFDVDPFARDLLTSGRDALQYLLNETGAISEWEARHG
ncbi:MAG: 3-isopropylmalate dehydratase small subunit [Planctomycetes bacterium]|nr:3-isopropylmalate dehydratase small subunit [Planctomycetota bacterium]